MPNRSKGGGGGGSSASGGGNAPLRGPQGTSGALTGGTTSGPGHTNRRGDADTRGADPRQVDQAERGTHQTEMGDIGVTGGMRGDVPEQQHRSSRTGSQRGASAPGQGERDQNE
jgi:hypothetical protein